jgi:hypothetical protein
MSNRFVQTKLCMIEGKFEVSNFFLRNVIFFISFPPIKDRKSIVCSTLLVHQLSEVALAASMPRWMQ